MKQLQVVTVHPLQHTQQNTIANLPCYVHPKSVQKVHLTLFVNFRMSHTTHQHMGSHAYKMTMLRPDVSGYRCVITAQVAQQSWKTAPPQYCAIRLPPVECHDGIPKCMQAWQGALHCAIMSELMQMSSQGITPVQQRQAYD